MDPTPMRARPASDPGTFLLALGVVLVTHVSCLARFCRLPLEDKLARIPDDGFYYLNLARNFARSGHWTFDGGVSRTTAFHPLYACVASLLARTTDDTNTLLGIHGALGFSLTFAGAACVLAALGRDARAWCGALLVFTGGACSSCPLMLMEWPFVVASQGLLMLLVLRGGGPACFVVGAMSVLARTDSIVPVGLCAFGVFAAIHFDAARCILADRVRLRAAQWALGGALVAFLGYGYALWLATGSFFQGSARMKAYWAATEGIAPWRMLGIPWRSVPFGWWTTETPSPACVWLGAGICAAAVLAALASRWRGRGSGPVRTDAFGVVRTDTMASWVALVMVLGTSIVYALDIRDPEPWYTAHFIVPVSILAGAGARALFRTTHPAVPFGALIAMAVTSFAAARAPIWPHHGLLAAAGDWIRDTEVRAVSYHAGIVGYMSGSRVVNLDGLANDDIHPFIFAGTTACYMASTAADLLIDTDCGAPGDPHADTRAFSRGELAHATRRVRTFGRAGDGCFVAAWQIDPEALRHQCQYAASRPRLVRE